MSGACGGGGGGGGGACGVSPCRKFMEYETKYSKEFLIHGLKSGCTPYP